MEWRGRAGCRRAHRSPFPHVGPSLGHTFRSRPCVPCCVYMDWVDIVKAVYVICGIVTTLMHEIGIFRTHPWDRFISRKGIVKTVIFGIRIVKIRTDVDIPLTRTQDRIFKCINDVIVQDAGDAVVIGEYLVNFFAVDLTHDERVFVDAGEVLEGFLQLFVGPVLGNLHGVLNSWQLGVGADDRDILRLCVHGRDGHLQNATRVELDAHFLAFGAENLGADLSIDVVDYDRVFACTVLVPGSLGDFLVVATVSNGWVGVVRLLAHTV
eukprot:1383078-Amorphochlora_amoeboformis.AAC.1